MLSADAGEVLAAKSRFKQAFGISNYLFLYFFLSVSACFGRHDCGPQTNPFGKRVLRLFGSVLRSSGGRGSLWQLTEEPRNFSDEFRYCCFRSKHIQTRLARVGEVALRAASCYPATIPHMCAPCRTAELIPLAAHLKHWRCGSIHHIIGNMSEIDDPGYIYSTQGGVKNPSQVSRRMLRSCWAVLLTPLDQRSSLYKRVPSFWLRFYRCLSESTPAVNCTPRGCATNLYASESENVQRWTVDLLIVCSKKKKYIYITRLLKRGFDAKITSFHGEKDNQSKACRPVLSW